MSRTQPGTRQSGRWECNPIRPLEVQRDTARRRTQTHPMKAGPLMMLPGFLVKLTRNSCRAAGGPA